tara:strand:- start:894 stop:1451 length:558 start_codon:yes stop_codon:yes gene_type:complete
MIHECECLPKEIIDICNNTFTTHIGIEGFTGKGYDPSFRKTECRYIQRSKEIDTPQPKGIELLEKWINEQGYDYTPEIIQIARYHKGHFYKWHTDGAGRDYRKLSMSCLLNDPSEFEGGEMEFKSEKQKTTIKLKKHHPILFMPDLEHQVLPVLEGHRDSLVVWFLQRLIKEESNGNTNLDFYHT